MRFRDLHHHSRHQRFVCCCGCHVADRRLIGAEEVRTSALFDAFGVDVDSVDDCSSVDQFRRDLDTESRHLCDANLIDFFLNDGLFAVVALAEISIVDHVGFQRTAAGDHDDPGAELRNERRTNLFRDFCHAFESILENSTLGFFHLFRRIVFVDRNIHFHCVVALVASAPERTLFSCYFLFPVLR